MYKQSLAPIISIILFVVIAVGLTLSTYLALNNFSQNELFSTQDRQQQLEDEIQTQIIDATRDQAIIQTPYDNLSIYGVYYQGQECLGNEGESNLRTLVLTLSSCSTLSLEDLEDSESSSSSGDSGRLIIETDKGIIDKDIQLDGEGNITSLQTIIPSSSSSSEGGGSGGSSGSNEEEEEVVEEPLSMCYNSSHIGMLGNDSPCIGMLIVNRTMLDNALDLNGGIDKYIVHNGTNYTFGNSSYNIFTGQVRDMSSLFAGTFSTPNPFNSSISYWDTENVTDMSNMFYRTSSFNQPLNFDTHSVTDMSNMFRFADSFNQPLDFDTSSVTSMYAMFQEAASFNQSLNFNTSSVISMSYMFSSASSFNQPLNFNTSRVTDMGRMFYEASSFNQPLDFDTSTVTNMYIMFRDASSFNQNLSCWDVILIDSEPSSFKTGSALSIENEPSWGTKGDCWEFTSSSFEGCYNSSSVGSVGVGGVCDEKLIVDRDLLITALRQDINVSGTIYNATLPNGVFTGQVTDMSGINSVGFIPSGFNSNISYWNTSSSINMSSMFRGVDSFNQPLNFNTSQVTDMSQMFRYTNSFNQPLDFDTSSVTDMSNMFEWTSSFNQSLNFNTSSVTDMSYMFRYTNSFNQPLDFDTSSVTDMSNMFEGTSSFNQSLDFDTSSVTDMNYMFRNAASFNQNLTCWNVTQLSEPLGFFSSSALSPSNEPVWGTDGSSC